MEECITFVFRVKDGDDTLIQNTGNCPQDYLAAETRRTDLTSSQL
jgi:hypothetical protein